MKENNNNTYSFYTIDQSKFNDSLGKNDTVYHNMNDQIVQSYCFATGNTSLYRKIKDTKYSLLYDKISLNEDDSTAIYIYTPNMLYMGMQKNDNFTNIFYMNKKSSLTNAYVFTPLSQIPGIKHINDILSARYSAKHLNPIVSNSKLIDTKENRFLAKDFKETYMRYSMAARLIPAQSIIKELLRTMTHYIATGELDDNTFYTDYLHLYNFSDMCSSTIKRISEFSTNPEVTNYIDLCDFLRNKITNMDKLINMYLSDELER